MEYFQVTFPKENAPKGMKRRFDQVSKQVRKDLCYFWWDNQLVRHFAPKARLEYGYEERSGKYNNRKRRKGINRPLVYRGKMKDAMLSRRPPATTYKGEARIKFTGLPRYTYYISNLQSGGKRGKRLVNQPNKPRELTTVSERDGKEMAKEYQRRFSKAILKGA